MTTSNHRPYTYPPTEGIAASGSGRKGAVQYTDAAIAAFIEQARTKPWFDNTMFVIVADHCANSAGKCDLPITKYHIPLIVYAPSLAAPARVDTLCSQIDVAPTLLGLLGWTYRCPFYGQDILADPPDRAFIANYQKIGLYRGNCLYVLLPGKGYEVFAVDDNGDQIPLLADSDAMAETIMFYQTAGYLIEHRRTQSKGAFLAGHEVLP